MWTDTRPDARTYARVLLASIAERQKWRAQYEAAKAAAPACGQPSGNHTAGRPRLSDLCCSGSPIAADLVVSRLVVNG